MSLLGHPVGDVGCIQVVAYILARGVAHGDNGQHRARSLRLALPLSARLPLSDTTMLTLSGRALGGSAHDRKEVLTQNEESRVREVTRSHRFDTAALAAAGLGWRHPSGWGVDAVWSLSTYSSELRVPALWIGYSAKEGGQ